MINPLFKNVKLALVALVMLAMPFSYADATTTLVAQPDGSYPIRSYNAVNNYPSAYNVATASSTGTAFQVNFFVGASSDVQYISWTVQDVTAGTTSTAYFGPGCDDQTGYGDIHTFHEIQTSHFSNFGGITIVAGHQYVFNLLGSKAGGGGCTFYTTGHDVYIDTAGYSTASSSVAFSILDDYGDSILSGVNTNTRIDSVEPYDGQTVTTGEVPYDFKTFGYINAGDYKTGARVRLKIDRNTDQQAVGALAGFNSAFGNYTYLPIVVDGTFVVDATNTNPIPSRNGLYTLSQDIQVPGIGIHWGFVNFDLTYTTLVSTSTQFTIGTSTAIDNITTQATNYLNNLASSTSQGDPLATCQFSWFSSAIDFSLGGKLMDCMGGLVAWAIIPQPGAIALSFSNLRDGVLIRAPWGYPTRLIQILVDSTTGTTTATTTLQSVAFTVPIYLTGTSSPDTTLTFDPGDMLDGGASLLNGIKANGTDKNMKDIVEPFILLFIAISLVIIIFHDLMQMGEDSIERGSGEGGRHNRNSNKYREWLYNNARK